MIIHAEMGPRLTFCGRPPQDIGDEPVIQARDWHRDTFVIQQVTCDQCLLRVYMLGDSASIALARMGRKVEVKDDPGDEAVS